MTPQPMSDAEILALREFEGKGIATRFDKIGFALAILAARDAQWREMLGEPEGWVRDQRNLHDGIATLDPLFLLGAPEPAQGLNGATYSPLYAIKEPK